MKHTVRACLVFVSLARATEQFTLVIADNIPSREKGPLHKAVRSRSEGSFQCSEEGLQENTFHGYLGQVI